MACRCSGGTASLGKRAETIVLDPPCCVPGLRAGSAQTRPCGIILSSSLLIFVMCWMGPSKRNASMAVSWKSGQLLLSTIGGEKGKKAERVANIMVREGLVGDGACLVPQSGRTGP